MTIQIYRYKKLECINKQLIVELISIKVIIKINYKKVTQTQTTVIGT